LKSNDFLLEITILLHLPISESFLFTQVNPSILSAASPPLVAFYRSTDR